MTTPFNKPHVPFRSHARYRWQKDKRKKPMRVCPRAWKMPALLEAVREYVVKRRAEGENLITAEEIAGVLRAKKGDVTGCLVKLVPEGLVGHKQRFTSWDGDWYPSVYFLPRVNNNRGR
jgi:hypothetical protein